MNLKLIFHGVIVVLSGTRDDDLTFAKMLWNNFFVVSIKCFPVLNLFVSVFLQTKQAEKY